jgi:flagellar basal-body rod protein FlgG
VNAALLSGAAGMAAQSAILDAIAGNLANLDAPGFRATRPEFAALVAPDGSSVGIAQGGPRTLFSQGRLEDTDDQYDLAIDGDGLFQVRTAGGKVAYSRAGDFTPDATGRLVLHGTYALDGVRLPRGTTSIIVDAGGRVRANVAGKTQPVIAGRIRLASFLNLAGLTSGDDGLYFASSSAGRAFRGSPGSGGFGSIKQRSLERGNVSVVDEMMAMLAAQRAYEANAKSVQAADEMLRLANNLERG